MNRNRLLILGILVLALALGSIMPVAAQDSGSLLIWADGERAPLLTELGEQFSADFGVPVEVQEVDLGSARDQLLVAGPVGEGPDILIAPHDHIGQHVANGAIVPIDLGDMADSFLPAALNLFTYNGELWGMPYAMENVALIRNVDLVPERPATWQEVQAISEELASSGAAEYGFLIQTGDTYHNFPIISAFGGYIFGLNDDGTFNVGDIGLASEGGLAAAEWLAGMYEAGLMVPDVNSDVTRDLWSQGQLAMWVTGPWFSADVTSGAEEGGFAYAIDPLPGAEGGLDVGAPFAGGQGFLISAFSENQLLAESFLFDYVATDEVMQRLFDEGGRIPAWVTVDTSSDPNIASFIAAGENSIPMPAIPEMSAVWSAAGNALTLISTGEDPVESMTTASAQIVETIGMMDEEVVGVPGSYQAAVGCSGDWQPECELTHMTDNGDGTWSLTITIPAGDYEYKIALNNTWDENYGANGERDGANIALSLSADTEVTFTYDAETNIVTDSVNNP
jgi:maltose/maltodextrin transport system substrate-binding protein/arabinogalactan oligomer/maltooligosaccharide transport system substrate-binding protein